MGRKMMASLASGILVQTAARTVMMAPDWKHKDIEHHDGVLNVLLFCHSSETLPLPETGRTAPWPSYWHN